MTEEVLLSIKGLQMMGPEDEDETEVVTKGTYLKKGNKHYIRYEEVVEGMEGTILNLIKVDENGMEVTKKGLTNVHMVFEKEKKNMTYYDTPFGSLLIGIAATNLEIVNGEQDIDVTVQYALDVNYEHLADCSISMNIKSMNQSELHLTN